MTQRVTRMRLRDVAAYLNVSPQRVQRIYHDGKLPAPAKVDGRSPLWKPAAIERWAEREWWGHSRTPWRRRVGGNP